jgi:dihydroorotate dehydrogenase
VPLALKIAPDLESDSLKRIAEALVTHNMDAVIATNTTLARDKVLGSPHAEEAGGLSGAPLFDRSNQVIFELAQCLQGAVPIIGVGGILKGEDARSKLEAGASLVQLYSGLIYRGPALVREAVTATHDFSPA